jgi:hypothetical protein
MRGTPQLGSAASAPAQNNRISCILSKKLPKQKKTSTWKFSYLKVEKLNIPNTCKKSSISNSPNFFQKTLRKADEKWEREEAKVKVSMRRDFSEYTWHLFNKSRNKTKERKYLFVCFFDVYISNKKHIWRRQAKRPLKPIQNPFFHFENITRTISQHPYVSKVMELFNYKKTIIHLVSFCTCCIYPSHFTILQSRPQYFSVFETER